MYDIKHHHSFIEQKVLITSQWKYEPSDFIVEVIDQRLYYDSRFLNDLSHAIKTKILALIKIHLTFITEPGVGMHFSFSTDSINLVPALLYSILLQSVGVQTWHFPVTDDLGTHIFYSWSVFLVANGQGAGIPEVFDCFQFCHW